MSKSNHRVAALLTGVSLATLSFLTGRGTAVAAGTTFTGSGNKTISTNFDFVNIESPADYSLVTNNATISDGSDNPLPTLSLRAVGVGITNNAIVSEFVNNKVIQAHEGTDAANGAPESEATAIGMLVDGTVPMITNNGRLQALAVGHGTGAATGFAFAKGISEFSSGLTTAAFAVANNNHISATAVAFGTGHSGKATAFATGVRQSVLSTGNGSASVTNNAAGLIFVQAHAFSTGTSHVQAQATAYGVHQIVGGTGSASPSRAAAAVVNSGKITALATATASQSIAHARAQAFGVSEYAADAQIISALVSNSGSINGLTKAIASGASATAYALGIGVRQIVTDAAAAYATVNNAGAILGQATAHAKGTTGTMHAQASAAGVRQTAEGLTVFNALVTNSSSGTISGLARAIVIGGTNATDYARAAGVSQFAGSFTVANMSVANSGHILAQAHASASNSGRARAEANASGVYQTARGGEFFGASVTNNAGGSIGALAVASAKGAAGFASAFAHGIFQSGIETTGVTVSVVNSGSILGQASAYAVASTQSARASAQASGVYQHESRVDGVTAAVVNSTGGVMQGLAKATAQGARANATAYAAGVSQYASDFTAANLSVTNSGSIFARAAALAISSSGSASAHAYAAGVRQFASTDDFRTAITASVTNSAGASIVGIAQATARNAASGNAVASAYAWGVSQYAEGVEAVSFTVSNSGNISGSAAAFASAPHAFARASATAYGVLQAAATEDGGAVFTAVVNNSGNISANARATAIGGAEGSANALAHGVLQTADGYAAMNFTVANTGNIMANAKALVSGSGSSFVGAFASAVGVGQFAEGFGILNASVTNSAGAVIAANAIARQSAATGSANGVEAFAVGVSQYAGDGGLASLTVTNSGHVQAQASAYAFALHGNASAIAGATGVAQRAEFVAGVTGVVTNNAGGGIFAIAKATAHGAATGFAGASASAYGIVQTAGDDTAFASFTVNNSGSIGALAQAAARGGSAYAFAGAIGVEQAFLGVADALATVNNSGAINATALAHAVGTRYSTAVAGAIGIAAVAKNGTPFTISIANSGNIRAFANAAATGATGSNHAFAAASAIGIFAAASADIEGTISNSGHIWASAIVAHGSSGYAHAVGIWDPPLSTGGTNNTTITNTGLINAYAQVPNKGMNGGTMAAYATGILISGSEEIVSGALENSSAPQVGLQALPQDPPPAFPAKTVVINDGGTIWAGTSQDGGRSVQRGNAINTTGVSALNIPPAPNGVLIELQGNSQPGHIFGDILIGANDQVDVFNGKTFFDGIVNNPSKMAQIAPSAGYPFVGTFNLQNGSKLVLCQEGWTGACDSGGAGWAGAGPGGHGFDPASANNGPSYVFSNTFETGSTATLAYQLTPLSTPSSATGFFTNPANPPVALTSFTPGSYSQVLANTVHLGGGTLQALYLPGFYANSTTYQHVIEGAAVSGTFASVTDNSILLNTTADVHDGAPGFVNLNVTRTAFGSVSGLTQNQSSAGGGIEKVYGQLPGPGTNPASLGSSSQAAFDKLVAGLFTIDNAADYGKALDQLSGAQYAQQLQSVIWSTRELNQTLTDRMECQIDGTSWQSTPAAWGQKKQNAPMPGCFQPGQWTVWAQGHGAWDGQKGDTEAPGYKEGQVGAYLGADYAFTPDWFLGAAAGYFSSNMDFNSWGGVSGGSIRYDGFQIAGYGGYDDRAWYTRGILAYGNYTGSSTRFVSISGTPVDPHGSPDAGVLSFYGEAGHRFALAPNWTATPFIGLGIARGWIDSFTESDDNTGANLAIHESSGTSVASHLGGRLSTVWGGFIPEVSLAWQHEFGNTRQTVNASFASAPAGADFSVVGANVGRDGADVTASLSYALGPQNKISVQYDGFFTGNYYSNAVVGRWTATW